MPEIEITEIEESAVIEKAFQTLINIKHLYQNVDVDFEPVIIDRASKGWGAGVSREAVTNLRRQMLSRDWQLTVPGYKAGDRISFSFPPVKTMCGRCGSVEPFNTLVQLPASSLATGASEQVFSIPLQCQACKSNVIVFLVRRDGTKLQLVGRSEFEKVKAPDSIPKNVKDFYSQASIAFNCGQTLAALFLLRTLIEQDMRAVTKRTDLRGDDLCDEYNHTLPDEFKSQFPSFKDIYDKLSEALHRGDPSDSLFESEIERIQVHFDGLAVFERARAVKGTTTAKT